MLHILSIELIKFIIFLSFFQIHSEVEQSLAGLISDRATDEVVEALTRYRRGLGISDSPSMHFDDHQTPDVVRSRSSQVSTIFFFQVQLSNRICFELRESVG